MFLQRNLFAASFVTWSFVFGLQLPDSHILWGPEGKPNTLLKRATSSTLVAGPTTTSKVADGSCSNGAYTRECWSDGFSISADFDSKWPTTGKTRYYNFEITNTTCAPDGILKQCLLINNQYPGPTVYADWGDKISITVKNSLENNGTGIHFHGIRQLNSNSQDGANGLTECPLAPDSTKTYLFQATQVSKLNIMNSSLNSNSMAAVGIIVIIPSSMEMVSLDQW
jgi:hypothetical protein